MEKRKIKLCNLMIAFFIIMGTSTYFGYYINKDQATGVYHMRGESFNSSVDLGSIKVSPMLESRLFDFAMMIFIGAIGIVFFVHGGGLELFNSENQNKEGGKK